MIRSKYLTLIILLIFLSVSGSVLAVKKKPKLEIPVSNVVFKTSKTGITTLAAARSVEFKTPQGAKLFNSKALFEWNQPKCNNEISCSVFIDKENNGNREIIHSESNITSNNYAFNPEKFKLQRGTIYNFYVISDKKPEDLLDREAAENAKKFPLQFYYLSVEETDKIYKQFSKIIKNDNKIDQLIDETNILLKNGIWFDSINNINKLISLKPEDKELDEYKNKIYQLVKAKSK